MKLKDLDTHTKHPLYRIWAWIKTRCYNKNSPAYKEYWWRWLTVSNEWRFDMTKFILDMEDEYFIHKKNNKTTHLDRTNNNKWYSKENCRFVTAKINCRNTRKNILYKWKCIAEWAEELGINYNTMYWRINRGKLYK